MQECGTISKGRYGQQTMKNKNVEGVEYFRTYNLSQLIMYGQLWLTFIL